MTGYPVGSVDAPVAREVDKASLRFRATMITVEFAPRILALMQ